MIKSLLFLERAAAFAQGKGYGSNTVRREFRAARRLFTSPPALMIDIGANKGLYTSEMTSTFPESVIHIFEPSEVNITFLKDRFQDSPKILLAPVALGERKQDCILFSDEAGSGLASLTNRKLEHFGIDFKCREVISVIRFEDYWIEQLQGRNIDFAKIDVEGHELDVLKGFGAALAKTQVFQFEFGGCNIDTRTYFRDFWYFFKENGFDIFRIGPISTHLIEKYRESDEFFSTTNFLAKRRF